MRETAEAIAAGRLTCVEAVQRCLARAEASEGAVKAFVRLDPDAALRQARQRDREIAAGYQPRPLDGMPLAVKDVIDVEGLPTMGGSKVLPERPAAQDAEIIASLRSAGAIVSGKATTHEFAYGAATPPTRNPSDVERIAGGSSGGSAAAVAAGSALLGVGSDTGGSVRLPAALCGVAGFRPRFHPSIGMRGIIPLAPEFDAWGLIAPSAADLALVWSALTQSQPSDAAPERFSLVVPQDVNRTLPDLDPDVRCAFAETMQACVRLGLPIEHAQIPDLRQWRTPRMTIQMRQVLEVHRTAGWWPVAREIYSEETRSNLEIAEAQADDALDGARSRLAELDALVDAILSPPHVFALPTVPVTAPRADDVAQMKRDENLRHPLVGLLGQATLPFSRSTLAALTVPCGRSADGLPVGLQLIGTDEATVLGAAAWIEAHAVEAGDRMAETGVTPSAVAVDGSR